MDFLLRHETLRPDTARRIWSVSPGGVSLVYVYAAPRYPETRNLPIGAQARLIRAAVFSEQVGTPINTLLTVNAAHLQRIDEGGIFGVGHLWDGFRDFLELVRKWVTGRDIAWAALWAREYAGGVHGQVGEHWHIGLYLPSSVRRDFAAQVALWTGEDIDTAKPTKPTVARSVCRAWHLRGRAPSGHGPEGVAAYLGKAEPSWRRHYGRSVPNLHKPVRRRVGGRGPIQGKRFGISRSIGSAAQTTRARERAA